MSGFLIVAIVASTLAVIATVFDGIFEMFDLDLPGDSTISVMALFGGIAAFGWTGVAATTLTAWAMWVILAVSVLAGVAILAACAWITSVLRRQSTPHSAGSVDSIVGVTGVLDTASAPGKPGIVRLLYAGAPRTMTAHADVDLAAGTPVVVSVVVSPDVVHVVPQR